MAPPLAESVRVNRHILPVLPCLSSTAQKFSHTSAPFRDWLPFTREIIAYLTNADGFAMRGPFHLSDTLLARGYRNADAPGDLPVLLGPHQHGLLARVRLGASDRASGTAIDRRLLRAQPRSPLGSGGLGSVR